MGLTLGDIPQGKGEGSAAVTSCVIDESIRNVAGVVFVVVEPDANGVTDLFSNVNAQRVGEDDGQFAALRNMITPFDAPLAGGKRDEGTIGIEGICRTAGQDKAALHAEPLPEITAGIAVKIDGEAAVRRSIVDIFREDEFTLKQPSGVREETAKKGTAQQCVGYFFLVVLVFIDA